MKGRLHDELAQATRSSRCLLTLRLQQLFSRQSRNNILFLLSQYLLWSNRSWFGQLKAVTLARWLIPRQAHAVYSPSPSSWSRAKASRPAISIHPSRWRILQEFSNFNHLPLHYFLKTLNTTMLFKRICSTSYSFKSCILPVEVTSSNIYYSF